MHSQNYTNIYQSLKLLIDTKPETEAIQYLNSLDQETCNAIALMKDKDDFNLIDLLIHSKKNSLLEKFIEKISDDTCLLSGVYVAHDEMNTFDRMTTTPLFSQFIDKLPHTFLDGHANHLRTYHQQENISNLQVIAENQTPEVFSTFLSQLSYLTCQKLAPGFFKTIDVDYLDVENFQHYLKKTGFITINNYILSNTDRSKKLIEHLISKRQSQFFLAFCGYLQPDAINHILSNFQLPPQALASLSFSKLLPNILRAQKNLGLKILSSAMEPSAVLKPLQTQTTSLKSIQFYDGGESEDTWSPISQALFSHAPKIKPHSTRVYLTNEISKIKIIADPNTSQRIYQAQHQFLRVQGRTILQQDSEGNIIATKVQKKDELLNELEKEYQATYYLKQHDEKLQLKSIIPTPLMIGKTKNILPYVKENVSEEEFKQFAEMIDDQLEHNVYVYEVNPKQCDYFTYLHDPRINDEIFKKANHDVVHDLYHLLQKGMVFPQLADIFHNNELNHDNRYDKGRYIVLLNLLNVDGIGSGRLTGWKKAVQYPNLRVSGIADLGDCLSLQEMTINGPYLNKYFKFVLTHFQEKSGNYLLANLIAEYQYVLFLIAGCRAAALTKTAKFGKEADIWLSMAKQILANCVQATHILTQKPEEKIQAFLSSKMNVYRLARQMRYWMTTDYIQDVTQNKISENIYEKNTFITINHRSFRPGTFWAHLGFSLNGIDPDLGPVNGQEPIKEANKLIYEMINYIFTSHHLLNETLTDLTKIIKEKDIKKSEEMRKTAFSFLPESAQEKIQFSLGKERLKQKIPDDVKSDIITQQRNIAGNKIRRFWRTRQSVKRIATMPEYKADYRKRVR
jgi:hypothetical protein